MTTAEVEDIFDLPQTCHPSSCGECWRRYTNRKECKTMGTDLWAARRKRIEDSCAAMAEEKYLKRQSLGKETKTQYA